MSVTEGSLGMSSIRRNHMNDYESCKYDGEKKYIENEPHGFEDFKEIMHILRNHCPWDKTQTFESLKDGLTDEAREAADAIDNDDAGNLCEELGDVFMQIVLMSEIAEEKGLFSIDDVIQGASDKMIRRHPHVFGDEEIRSEEDIHSTWKRIKAIEKAQKAAHEKISLKSFSGNAAK